MFLPAGLGAFALPSLLGNRSDEFRYHPRYRSEIPLDAIFLNRKAGFDRFVSEKYHDQVAATLAEWSSGLLQASRAVKAVANSLTADFRGASQMPSSTKTIRPGPGIEVQRLEFSPDTGLNREAFLNSFVFALSTFDAILTAEFQITKIDVAPSPLPEVVQTSVRYELVGTCHGFHREQRVGEWALEWQADESGQFLVRRWKTLTETLSRSTSPVYADIADAAFGANPSYRAQLCRGVDYWRTVLDVASGIDIYGHNGVSVGDINGNGFDDLYVCQPAGLPNRLYRNRGDGSFEDITEGSGLGLVENTACSLFADFANSGHQDLIVVCTDGPRLFLNDGTGNFHKQKDAFHFAKPPQGTFTGAAVADYDRDGFLDVYFCLYLYYQGTDQYKYPSPYFDAQNGPPNFLMKNNRDGTFRDVTAETGLNVNNTRYSFCCAWSDFSDDGWPDLYVVNDFGRKNLYRNNGNGTFTDIAGQSGVEDIGAGMSVSSLDYDNDGHQDLYVANMWTAAGERISTEPVFEKEAPEEIRAMARKHAMGNSLFRNQGNGTFQSVGGAAGVEMGRWAWSSDPWDFDHDGYPDLYIANGMVSGLRREDLNSFFWRQVVANSPATAKPSADYEQGWNAMNELLREDGTWSGYERNVFYANHGDGSFSDVSGAVGLDFVEDGRAFALSDFNHDGRLEVFLKNRNAPQLRLLQNVMPNLPPSIAFRLQGVKSNRDAVGAKIVLETEAGRQTRIVQAGSGFLSQHSKEVVFGLGLAKSAAQATIHWPSGLVQVLSGLSANHRVWVTEGMEPTRVEAFHEPSPPLASVPLETEPLPEVSATWLLSPILAPDCALPSAAGGKSVSALQGRNVWLTFYSAAVERNIELLPSNLPPDITRIAVNVDADSSREPDLAQNAAAIYSLLYRYLFDRHRDLPLPSSFLIDKQVWIVKVYQGPVEAAELIRDCAMIPQNSLQRIARALPFPVVTDGNEFRRNYLSLGSVFFQRGYYEQSLAFFQTAIQDDPDSAEAHYGFGSACLKLQKTGEARASFERATQVGASYPDTVANAWNNLGLLAAQEGKTAEAIPSFQEALLQNPENFIAALNLGNAFRQQRRWEDARKSLLQAAALKPEDPEVNYSLGMVFAQTDDTASAFLYLKKALKARPAYPEALNNRGVLFLRTQQRDSAVASFRECIRVAPEFDQSYLNLARVYALEGDSAQARAVLSELLRRHPGHLPAQQALDQLQKP